MYDPGSTPAKCKNIQHYMPPNKIMGYLRLPFIKYLFLVVQADTIMENKCLGVLFHI